MLVHHEIESRILKYDGWCRRIDLTFRSMYPYLNTRIFKLSDYKYQILVIQSVEDFPSLTQTFNHKIRYATAPVELVALEPETYISEIECIKDENIPSRFEGFPLTLNQTKSHIASIHTDLKISKIEENHEDRSIIVEVMGSVPKEALIDLQKTVDGLKSPYSFIVKDGGSKPLILKFSDEIFTIAPSQSKKFLNCPFLERDEKLWFDNVESIYNGSFKKEDLYFFEAEKTSCLVNFSMFENANLRNHLLLYDIVYCVLPLVQDMSDFLQNQKITRDEILGLVERGRLKILNMQPESRLDYGFINEAFQTNSSMVVSRRALSALSALCAIDLVGINS